MSPSRGGSPTVQAKIGWGDAAEHATQLIAGGGMAAIYYGFVRVIAVLLNPEPFSVPVMVFPLTVAVRFRELKPGADIVSPNDGAA